MRLPSSAIDNCLLVVVCQDETCLHRLNVDDFDDPHEVEVSSDQIHLTIIKMEPGKGESELSPCLKLSTTSALELVRRLNVAILKRGGEA
jgi:hypothetical protein